MATTEKTDLQLIVIYGGAGDLARTKLLPALFRLTTRGSDRQRVAILAVGTKLRSDSEYRGLAVEELEEELSASLSCRGAIKINHRLTQEEQRALLSDLQTTDNPYRCPHGRPIILRLSQEEMERRLGRR